MVLQDDPSLHNRLGGVLHVTAKFKPSNMLQHRLFYSTSLMRHYALHRVSYKVNQLQVSDKIYHRLWYDQTNGHGHRDTVFMQRAICGTNVCKRKTTPIQKRKYEETSFHSLLCDPLARYADLPDPVRYQYAEPSIIKKKERVTNRYWSRETFDSYGIVWSSNCRNLMPIVRGRSVFRLSVET